MKSIIVYITLFLSVICCSLAYAKEPIIIKVAMGSPEGDAMVVAMRDVFSKYVYEKSSGKYKVVVYPGQVLGSPNTVINSVRYGLVHFTNDAISNLTQFSSDLSLLDLPFMIKSREFVDNFNNSLIKNKLFEKLNSIGVENFGVILTDYRVLATRIKVKTLEDVKGLKIRTTSSKNDIETTKSFGMIPTPMNASEMYIGVQQGVIDGFFPDMTNVAHRKFYEVAPYICFLDHMPVIYAFNTSKKWLYSLSEEDRNIFIEAAKLYLYEASKNCVNSRDKDIEIVSKNKYVEFNYLNSEEKEKWVNASSVVYSKLNSHELAIIQELYKLN